MIDIITQMNPATLTALILLLALGFLGAVILQLIRSGKAKSPKDLVKVARDRAAASKATKEAHKQAEAAIAEPVASSRLSRIGARPAEGDESPELVSDDTPDGEFLAGDEPWDDSDEMAGEVASAPEPFDASDSALEEFTLEGNDEADAEAEAVAAESAVVDAPETTRPALPPQAAIDLADPANHPQGWDALVAMVNALEMALQNPWPEDRLLPVPRFEESEADPEGAARAASQRQSAIQLARTINGAAREQAQEVIAVVREFAYSAPFSAQDCAAVMAGLQAIEWMALIERGALVEKRTMPLTRHDPEAPLWVHDAVAAIYSGAQRNAA